MNTLLCILPSRTSFNKNPKQQIRNKDDFANMFVSEILEIRRAMIEFVKLNMKDNESLLVSINGVKAVADAIAHCNKTFDKHEFVNHVVGAVKPISESKWY